MNGTGKVTRKTGQTVPGPFLVWMIIEAVDWFSLNPYRKLEITTPQILYVSWFFPKTTAIRASFKWNDTLMRAFPPL